MNEQKVINAFNMILAGVLSGNDIMRTCSPQEFTEAARRSMIYEDLGKWGDRMKDIIPEISAILVTVGGRLKRDRELVIYPNAGDIFRAFSETAPHEVQAVLLGMDPYHDGSATGLAFDSEKYRPSLKALTKELKEDIGVEVSSIKHWAKNGILMLNTALTVEKGKPGSHIAIWKPVMSKIIAKIGELESPVVWILLGNDAKSWATHIPPEHYIVTAPHPSPLSRAFPGSKVFSRVLKLNPNITF